MAGSGGDAASDPKQKHAAGMGFNHFDKRDNGAPHSFGFEHMQNSSVPADSDSYKQKQFYDDAPSDEWQPSSASSTRQMLYGGQHRNGSSSSRSVASPPRPSSSSSSRRFTAVAFVKKIDWGSLWDRSKEWIRNPMDMALLVWIAAVGVSGAILFNVYIQQSVCEY